MASRAGHRGSESPSHGDSGSELRLEESGDSRLCVMRLHDDPSGSYHDAQMSRAKPWDDRELDSLEGFKFWSFKLTTISQTCF